NASFIVGFAGAGPLLKIAGPNAVFLVAALFFLVSAALVWTLPRSAVDSQPELPPSALDRSRLVARELLEGWAFLRSGPEIMRVMLQLAFAWSLTGVIAAIAPGYATTVLGLSEEDAFFLVVPAGAGVVLGSIMIGRFGARVDRTLLIASGLLGMGLAVILLAVYRQLLDRLLPHVPPQITFDVHPGGLSGFLI